MDMLKLHHADLSTETLKSIRNDIAKYSHLKLYKPIFEHIGEVIEARLLAERNARAKS